MTSQARSLLIVDNAIVTARDLRQRLEYLAYTRIRVVNSIAAAAVACTGEMPGVLFLSLSIADEPPRAALVRQVTERGVRIIYLATYSELAAYRALCALAPGQLLLRPFDTLLLDGVLRAVLLDMLPPLALSASDRFSDVPTAQTERLRALAGGIAHDLNNLLTIIAGHVDLLRLETGASPLAEECFTQVGSATRRASDLTRRLLMYAGRAHLSLQPLDINTLIAGVVRQLPAGFFNLAEVQIMLDETLPRVSADGTYLQEALISILVNAVESLDSRIGIIRITTTAADNAVVIEISDDGPGMAAATLARIFDPFYTTKGLGRGLGLAMVQGIIGEHNGTLAVSSILDQQTIVRIGLPLAAVPAEVPVPPPPTPMRNTVIVIDDEEALRSVAARLLGHLGYETILAADGERGIAAYREHQERTLGLLVDLTMPGMGWCGAGDGVARARTRGADRADEWL